METNINLILHNIVSLSSAIILLGITIFSFLHGKNKISNITFSLAALATTFFTLSHVIGANITNPEISRMVFMFNLSIFFIGAFNLHAVISIVNKNAEKFWVTTFVYTSAIAFSILFIISPDLFLLPSEPKMYFPNYYVPGQLNWIRVAFLYVAIIPYMIYLLLNAYKNSHSITDKHQYKYFAVTIIVAYALALIPNFLVYGIEIDPLWGMPFALLFSIPFVYGAVKYQLFNVKVIAKQAFFYAIGIVLVGGIITLLNYSNVWLVSAFPSYPTWITAMISAVLTVTISALVWKHLREGDLLKYEFITIVTHKFRGPLTGIKWATDNLKNANLSAENDLQVEYIRGANEKLVELTDILVTTSETEQDSYQYHFTANDLAVLTEEVIGSLESQLKIKTLYINKDIQKGSVASCDIHKIKFVLQTLIENAINYTHEFGAISITVKKEDQKIIFSVRDTGIGMSKEELNLIFSKFYRTHTARVTDTEGMGIGLYISKEVILRHKGKIWAESDGLGKGSVFNFHLPALPVQSL